MFSIGEFARLGGVSVRTLRHYDEIGLLPPATVDPETGYRGYTADQLGALNRIIALKELGLSLTQVSRLLAGITVGELRGMLALRRAQLEQELDARMNQLLGIEARLRYMEKEGAMPADDITVKKIPALGEPQAELPPPARYLTMPEIEAVTTIRNGASAMIFPMVYHDLARWADVHGYRTAGDSREIWINEVDDIADVEQQVFEIQLPFTR